MGTMQPFHVSMLVLLLALFGADIAEGYFLASSHGHFWAKDGVSQADQPVLKFAFDKPQERIETHFNASRISFARRANPREGPKYPVIEACHLKLEAVFGKNTDSWYLDWKLWVGLTFWFLMWAKWLAQGFDEIYWQFALFAFGLNIVILHTLQYASSIKMGMLMVCIVLTAQALIQSYLTHLREFASEASSASNASEADSQDALDEFDCDTLYLDLALPIEQIAILFIAQCGVWWFYMTSILNSFDFEKVNYLFWAWAYLVMQMTMIFCRGNDSALGNAFPVHDVHRICKQADKVSFSLPEEDGGTKVPSFQISKANILVRGVMGFFCNCILREIMAYTIPLMLMGFSEPMDFVVYCVGVNFICTLDDMSERKYTMTPLVAQEGAEPSREKSEAVQ